MAHLENRANAKKATPAPALSPRIVVTPPAQAAFAKRAVAATVPMPAFEIVPAAAKPRRRCTGPDTFGTDLPVDATVQRRGGLFEGMLQVTHGTHP